MMIVDLVDEVDFKEKLIAIGVPLSEDQPMGDVQETLLSWLKEYPEQLPFVVALFEEMTAGNVTVLPEVSTVIQAIS
ncbi:hypothetical protein [Marinomonas colpomeniae]|uniref:Uncharacterized protein n=1 Tax=Marinomonas colpomeniae TaxID=2774408 RepID=A0ABR8NW89_9GAMM|nr:hypothetical protein [Marinomonas colpomeniae]MBD5770322.1 hypothetical protein [Marinomonas colpomeniae]